MQEISRKNVKGFLPKPEERIPVVWSVDKVECTLAKVLMKTWGGLNKAMQGAQMPGAQREGMAVGDADIKHKGFDIELGGLMWS